MKNVLCLFMLAFFTVLTLSSCEAETVDLPDVVEVTYHENNAGTIYSAEFVRVQALPDNPYIQGMTLYADGERVHAWCRDEYDRKHGVYHRNLNVKNKDHLFIEVRYGNTVPQLKQTVHWRRQDRYKHG